MAQKIRAYNLQGLQLGLNPLLQKEGDFLRLVNVDFSPVGAITKRPGYVTYNSSIGGTVTSLWDWHKADGTTFYNYACSGGSVYYSTQGTGDWTICGNGTMTDNARIGFGILEETMLVGDGTAASRHTTSGTDFTNTSGAPVAFDFQDYQNRMYGLGSQDLFHSTTGTPTDWVTDSSSIRIPGPGHNRVLMRVSDRVVVGKNSGVMYRWDGYNLLDLSTKLAFTSPYSIGEVEGLKLGLNRKGYFGFNGDKPDIISNSITPQIYNDLGSGIAGSTFDSAPGVVHRYDYMCYVGTVTDDITNQTVTNCMQVYNYQLDAWRDYSMGTPVTALWSFKNNSQEDTLIFGDNSGQCYTFGGTATSDNGVAIHAEMMMVYHGAAPETDKKWNWFWAFFNPGCQAHIQIALADSFTPGKLNWVDLGAAIDGVVEFKFPTGSRGRLLFVQITESSVDARFRYYGMTSDWEPIIRN